jgi:hypothetical protein
MDGSARPIVVRRLSNHLGNQRFISENNGVLFSQGPVVAAPLDGGPGDWCFALGLLSGIMM